MCTVQLSERNSQRALDRGLAILDALEARAELAVADVARLLSVDPSTASRQLAVLANRGYVARDAGTGRYRLGVRLIRLGALAADRMDIRTLAAPVMKELWEVTGETVNLVIRDGAHCSYVEVLQGRQMVRTAQPVGLVHEIYRGASGKVFLAHMPSAEARALLISAGPVRLASGAIRQPLELESELQAIRVAGMAWSVEERIPGAAAVGFPIFDHSGSVGWVLGVSMPALRLNDELRSLCAEQGRAAARKLSAALGYPKLNAAGS